MKKLLISSLVIGAFTSSAWAQSGPANKVTGDITNYESFTGNCGVGGQYRQIDFNAHEAKDGRPAKGFFTETVLCSDGSINRYCEAAVQDVCVFADAC